AALCRDRHDAVRPDPTPVDLTHAQERFVAESTSGIELEYGLVDHRNKLLLAGLLQQFRQVLARAAYIDGAGIVDRHPGPAGKFRDIKRAVGLLQDCPELGTLIRRGQRRAGTDRHDAYAVATIGVVDAQRFNRATEFLRDVAEVLCPRNAAEHDELFAAVASDNGVVGLGRRNERLRQADQAVV